MLPLLNSQCWCEFMWRWITNQILKAGVKKITVMGALERENWAAQQQKMGKSFIFRGVEFIKSALEINFFNYFLNYPFHSFNIFFFIHSLSYLSLFTDECVLQILYLKSVQIMEFKANFHINKHIWKISNTEIGLCFNII